MAYQVRKEMRPASGNRDGTIYILEESKGAARAELWPALGFNCYLWQVTRQGRLLDLLYADPRLFNEGRATRSGIPVLFPFPNRIRDGRFTWEGKDYQLPLNDASGKTAIHGFACRRPWRILTQGADDHQAWLTGEFRGSVDSPEACALWPADYLIQATYRLTSQRLRIETQVQNPDRVPLPFGLGYHPYFRVPWRSPGKLADRRISVPAPNFWELHDSLPTGQRRPVDSARDLNTPRPVSELELDDVFTDLPNWNPTTTSSGAHVQRGSLVDPEGDVQLWLLCSPAFREMVVFTPNHRQAICVEPYTCTTDAINLQQQGIDAGLLILSSGETWTAIVEMVIS